jgi:lipoprotein-releasing system ATP-binding protein
MAGGPPRRQLRLPSRRTQHPAVASSIIILLPEFSALDNVMLPMRALGVMGDDVMRRRATTLLASLGLAEPPVRSELMFTLPVRHKVAVLRQHSDS